MAKYYLGLALAIPAALLLAGCDTGSSDASSDTPAATQAPGAETDANSDTPAEVPEATPISSNVIEKLVVEIEPTEEPGLFMVTFDNQSSEAFKTHDPNYPVRLSWRWVDDAAADESAAAGWDARQDLDLDLEPGETAKIEVDMSENRGPDADHLEVSIVQEGVQWFHDFGFEPAQYTVNN